MQITLVQVRMTMEAEVMKAVWRDFIPKAQRLFQSIFIHQAAVYLTSHAVAYFTET